MISCPTIHKRVIRSHYDLGTLFYRLVWGPHIHHGLWTGEESAREAQLQLTKTLAAAAGLGPGQKVLDVGCGMGASSIYLADSLGCQVTGVTISSVQRRWAQSAARWRGRSATTEFVCADIEKSEFEAASFDVVWSVECTEHLFDKAAFFRRVHEWLRPGGRVAICAWLAGDVPQNGERWHQAYRVCEEFLCPSLGTQEDYEGWMRQANLAVDHVHDWTDRVTRTWEICQRRTQGAGLRLLAKLVGHESLLFLDGFKTILGAYRSGALRYGCLVGHRPDESLPGVSRASD